MAFAGRRNGPSAATAATAGAASIPPRTDDPQREEQAKGAAATATTEIDAHRLATRSMRAWYPRSAGLSCGRAMLGAMFRATTGDVCELEDGSAGSKVSLLPARGAIVTSFRLEGRELLYLDETTLRDPKKNVRGGDPPPLPVAGKTGRRQVHLRGAKRGDEAARLRA